MGIVRLMDFFFFFFNCFLYSLLPTGKKLAVSKRQENFFANHSRSSIVFFVVPLHSSFLPILYT